MRTAWVKNALSGLLASLLTWASLVQSSTLETELLALKEAVQASRIEQDITTLAGFGTRHTLSDTESNERGIGAARRWIEAEFRRISLACGGCLEIQVKGAAISGEPRIQRRRTW